MITLERKEYQVKESEGEVEVCATLNSTYDVECAVPNGLHIKLSVLSGTAGSYSYSKVVVFQYIHAFQTVTSVWYEKTMHTEAIFISSAINIRSEPL